MDKTLLKGLALLELLARSDRPRGVSELARAAGLARSNIHRTLQTLAAAGFVRQDAAGRYLCTLKLFELGRAVHDRIDVVRAAEPTIGRLAGVTQETVHLSVLDGTDVVYVHKVDSPQPVRAYSHVGGRAPAHCVATGKALLAWRDPSGVDQLHQALVAYTPQTITAPEALAEELAQVRRQGFAVNRGEWRASVCGVAAPIRDATGAVVAAIGISGPAERLPAAGLDAFAPNVVAAAEEISRCLGFSAAAPLAV